MITSTSKVFDTLKVGLMLFASHFSMPAVKSQEVLTIQQAINKTLENNLTIKRAQLNQNVSEETLLQSKYALAPRVNASSDFSRNYGRSVDRTTNQFSTEGFSNVNGGVSANVDLFQGFQKINQIRANNLLLEADKTNVEKVKNDLILQVITAYMQVIFNKELLKTSTQQLEISKKTLERETILMDEGNKTVADVSLAKSQVENANLNVTTALNSLTISSLTLNQLMEMPAESKFELKPPTAEEFSNLGDKQDAPMIFNVALAKFPDIKLANWRTKAAERQIAVAKAGFFPSLSFGAGLGTNYSNRFPTRFYDQVSSNFNQNLGLSLQIPLMNGFSTRTQVRKAKIAYEDARLNEKLAKNSLNKVISQAVADLKAAESTYKSTQNAFAAQKDAFFVVEERYKVGLVNSLDYSTAQTNKNKAEIDFIRAKYDLLFRSKVIDYYLGKEIIF